MTTCAPAAPCIEVPYHSHELSEVLPLGIEVDVRDVPGEAGSLVYLVDVEGRRHPAVLTARRYFRAIVKAQP